MQHIKKSYKILFLKKDQKHDPQRLSFSQLDSSFNIGLDFDSTVYSSWLVKTYKYACYAGHDKG